MPSDHLAKGISVRGTEIRATDARQQLPRKNRAHHAGLHGPVRRAARRRGHGPRNQQGRARRRRHHARPTSKASRSGPRSGGRSREEINQGIRDAIARAAQGEFVRWDTPIYGRAGGKETIIIDASLMPGQGRPRQRRVHRLPKGATSPRRRRRSARSRRRTSSCRGCSSASASSTRSRRSSSPTSATSCGRRSR